MIFTKKNRIVAPISGTVIDIEDVNDEVFSKKMMGDGIAIVYQGGDVFAPFDGVVTAVVPSQHAVGITSTDGIEMIVHIGLETVVLTKDSPFECLVKLGQKVNLGQLLIRISEEKLISSGSDLSSPMVVVNAANKNIIKQQTKGSKVIATKDTIFSY